MAKQTLVPVNGIPRARSPYDQAVTIAVDTTGPVTITLPASATYDSDELVVELRGQALRPTDDYTFLGSPPRTQISVLQDLKAGDKIRLRKWHNP